MLTLRDPDELGSYTLDEIQELAACVYRKDKDTFRSLICGENSNPLAVFALTAEGTRIHVMSWPNHFPTSGDPLRNRVTVDAQAFAQMSKAFVISACGTVDEDMIARLEVGAEAGKFLRDPNSCGGSVIVAPNSRILAGPMGAEEGILYAECDLELGVLAKLRHDFAGHYNRPDIFQLQINRGAGNPQFTMQISRWPFLFPVALRCLAINSSARITEYGRESM